MTLVRWNPLREIESELADVQRRLGSFFGMPAGASWPATLQQQRREVMTQADWAPAADIEETPDAYFVRAELPDIKKEDVKVTLRDGVLSLHGERRRREREEKGRRFHRVERAYGRFERSFTLPGSVDETKLSANYRDGVLHVALPKIAGAPAGARAIKIS